ncbi:MAG: DUF3179 domain-containing protein [Rhodothermaceae bacterium]|nr:DUF3179 domain-containing protein [Rhodothermaceae bacterium]
MSRLLSLPLVFTVALLPLLGCQAQPMNDREQALPGFTTNTALRTIELSELRSGGPPKDGIPAIDSPRFTDTGSASEWIADQEPVILLRIGETARLYPLQILTYHEIVNDEVDGVPVSVTFCPLCYSAIAFDRRVETDDGPRTLDFGVSGMLRNSDLVMFDRQTETLWQQFTGEALVGDLVGITLDVLPAQIVSFAQAREAHPEAPVLSRETGHQRPYGTNPYAGYDDVGNRPFLYDGPDNGQIAPLTRVIAVKLDDAARAYPTDLTRERRVVHDTLGEQPVVVFHAEGAVTALGARVIADAREVGSTGVFDPRVETDEGEQVLRFTYENGRFVDSPTGTTWTITGEAVSGPLAGQRLRPLPFGDYFAFAWFAFRPETSLYRE